MFRIAGQLRFEAAAPASGSRDGDDDSVSSDLAACVELECCTRSPSVVEENPAWAKLLASGCGSSQQRHLSVSLSSLPRALCAGRVRVNYESRAPHIITGHQQQGDYYQPFFVSAMTGGGTRRLYGELQAFLMCQAMVLLQWVLLTLLSCLSGDSGMGSDETRGELERAVLLVVGEEVADVGGLQRFVAAAVWENVDLVWQQQVEREGASANGGWWRVTRVYWSRLLIEALVRLAPHLRASQQSTPPPCLQCEASAEDGSALLLSHRTEREDSTALRMRITMVCGQTSTTPAAPSSSMLRLIPTSSYSRVLAPSASRLTMRLFHDILRPAERARDDGADAFRDAIALKKKQSSTDEDVRASLEAAQAAFSECRRLVEEGFSWLLQHPSPLLLESSSGSSRAGGCVFVSAEGKALQLDADEDAGVECGGGRSLLLPYLHECRASRLAALLHPGFVSGDGVGHLPSHSSADARQQRERAAEASRAATHRLLQPFLELLQGGGAPAAAAALTPQEEMWEAMLLTDCLLLQQRSSRDFFLGLHDAVRHHVAVQPAVAALQWREDAGPTLTPSHPTALQWLLYSLLRLLITARANEAQCAILVPPAEAAAALQQQQQQWGQLAAVCEGTVPLLRHHLLACHVPPQPSVDGEGCAAPESALAEIDWCVRMEGKLWVRAAQLWERAGQRSRRDQCLYTQLKGRVEGWSRLRDSGAQKRYDRKGSDVEMEIDERVCWLSDKAWVQLYHDLLPYLQ